jgi:hypothetical protein
MKRLILIGNGFDLSHGYKSSYNDFICYYLCNALNHYMAGNCHDDVLLRIGSEESRNFTEKITTLSKSFEVLDILIKRGNIVEFKSNLFKEILFNIKTNKWVDIENHYFSYLIRYKHASNNNKKGIEDINLEFEFIKNEIEKYLLIIAKENFRTTSNRYVQLFCDVIKKDEIVLKEINEDLLPTELYFLNFNYTFTIENYIDNINKAIPSTINYIHGELDSKENPIIFGFGDEHDKHYLEFEGEKNYELFKHIKSFNYFKTSNYHNLIRFINSEDFQVYIIGHSCGLSDRTMLKEIFEHKNCKSIKIFYYKKSENENDFTEKTYDISRHFTDKGLMRKKIVPFQKSKPLI